MERARYQLAGRGDQEQRMMADRPPTPFEIARDQLRAIGISLTMHPGTYGVNFARGSTEATAYFTDDLADAVEHGREMAASALAGFIARGLRAQEAADRAIAAAAEADEKPTRRRRRRYVPRSGKARRRQQIRQHNRRLRARAPKHRDDDEIAALAAIALGFGQPVIKQGKRSPLRSREAHGDDESGADDT